VNRRRCTVNNVSDSGSGPRLLDLRAASAHSGIPLWTLRRLIWNGAIHVVRLPSLDGREGKPMRRVLLDRADLDRWIDARKERA
jgi:hypothetical protein